MTLLKQLLFLARKVEFKMKKLLICLTILSLAGGFLGCINTAVPASVAAITDSDCVVLVEHFGESSHDAEVSMYVKVDGQYKPLFENIQGFGGYNGFCKVKEGDGKTPCGTFDMGMVFGIKPDPGSPVGYHQVADGDYWVGDHDSKLYNQFSRLSEDTPFDPKRAEHLPDYKSDYNYCVDMGYNSEHIIGKGSALFLHCSNGKATYGCVGIDEEFMITVIRNLTPTAKIIIKAKEL